LIELIIVGALIIVGYIVLLPIVRRRKRNNGGVTPKAVWLFIAIAVVLVIGLTVYSLLQHR